MVKLSGVGAHFAVKWQASMPKGGNVCLAWGTGRRK
jgi:hypothetical protein